MKKLQESSARCFIAYMCLVFPLFFHNNYIDIMQAKRLAFLFGGITFVIMMASFGLIDHFTSKTKTQEPRPGYECLLPVFFLISWGISFGLSIDKSEAFWGYGAKCTGLFVYVVGFLCAYLLWKYLTWTPILTWTFLFGAGIVSILQILNRWGIDPLGMYSNLIEEEKPVFISTVGQVNYNAAFNCLIIAVLLVLFMLCEELFSKIVFAAALLLAYAGGICCCSDSIYLAWIVMFYILLIYVCAHPKKWFRLVAALLLLDAAVFGVWICWSYIRQVRFWGISALLFQMKLHWGLTILLWIFILAGSLVWWKGRRIWKQFCIALMVALPVTMLGVFKQTIYSWQIASEVSWTGTRFQIWEKSWRTFANAPLPNKLFGYGFNNVQQALAIAGESQLGGEIIQDAHNIFLNSLLTSGVVGTLLLTGLLIGLLVKCIRSTGKRDVALFGCMIIVTYFTQGMLNGPQILTEPVYMVAFGVVAGTVKQKQSEK